MLHLKMLERGVLPFKPVGTCGRKGLAEEDWSLASLALHTTKAARLRRTKLLPWRRRVGGGGVRGGLEEGCNAGACAQDAETAGYSRHYKNIMAGIPISRSRMSVTGGICKNNKIFLSFLR